MKNILLFFRSNIERSNLTIVVAVILSVLLCIILTLFRNSFADPETENIKVGFLDYDNSSVSIKFKDYLNHELNITTIEDESYDKLTYQLIDRKISAIIEIPKELEKDGIMYRKVPKVTTTTLDDYENTEFMKAYINIYFASVNRLMAAADGDADLFEKLFRNYKVQEHKIEQEAAYHIDYKQIAANEGLRLSIGFFTMMTTLMSFCLAFIVMEDRKLGAFSRIQISPVKPEQYIIGTGLYAACSSLLIVITYCIYLIVRGYPINVPIGYIFLLMTLFLFTMLGFALIIAQFCKSENAMITLIIILGAVGPILGGAYFSVDQVSESLQRVSKVLPHYWIMQGIKVLIDNPNKDISTNIIILSLFVTLSFLIAAVKFVQKENAR
jgi:ABC-2 type transport system permease protein